jgi:hypothetical protein
VKSNWRMAMSFLTPGSRSRFNYGDHSRSRAVKAQGKARGKGGQNMMPRSGNPPGRVMY